MQKAVILSLFTFSWLFLNGPFAWSRPLQAAKPWIGISIDKGSKGSVLINAVIQDTPAARAGFQPGDEIFLLDGNVVNAPEQLIAYVHAKGVGNSVDIEFRRQGKKMKKSLKLEAQPDMLGMLRKLYVGSPAPAFELETLLAKKESIKSESLKGKVVLLEFWATWCPSCRASLPFIDEIAKGKKDLLVLAVTDEEAADLEAFAGKHNFSFTVARDPKKKIGLDYQVSSVPTFFLIDRQGIVRGVEVGAGDYLKGLADEIDKLLQEKI